MIFFFWKTAQNELLFLCQTLLPLDNNLPKSIDKLKKYVGIDKQLVTEKKFCQKCSSILDQTNVHSSCENKECTQFQKITTDFNYFHHVSFTNHLKKLIQGN